MTFNLGWGNAVAVRHAFLAGMPKSISFEMNDANLNYTKHEGNAKLIEITKSVLERQLGHTYQHILLANGASGAATLVMRAYAQKGYKTALTRMTPYFPVYPAMVESAGLIHSDMRYYQQSKKPIALIDSPSNPEGDITDFGALAHTPVIWDAVYHSNVYTYRKFGPITHDVVVGSYSKLLGLNGLRTGWIATDDYLLFERLKNVVSAEYCGLSSASDAILLEVLKDYKDPKFWDLFEFRARRNLDSNREEWSKLERYFAFAIPSNGMFHYTPMDAQCKALMQKSNIEWTSGHSLGTDDNYGRFNIGQDCKIVRAAVKEVLKNDRR